MLKHKKFLSLLLVLPFLGLISCAKPKEPYDVIKEDERLIEHHEALPKSLENNSTLPIDAIVVTFDGNELDWLGENSKEYKTEGKFFLVTNQTYPTNSIVTKLKVTTNVEKNDLKFYVAHYVDEKVYVSAEITVTITNGKAIKPWVWYTVSGVVIFGVVAMVFFTRRYKAKKEGKI